MPWVYRNKRRPGTAPGLTHFQAFVGPNTPFDPADSHRDLDTLPRPSTTVLLVEAALPVEWTKPGDIPYTPHGPLPSLGDGRTFLAAMADGSVVRLSCSTPPVELHRAIQIDGPVPKLTPIPLRR